MGEGGLKRLQIIYNLSDRCPADAMIWDTSGQENNFVKLYKFW